MPTCGASALIYLEMLSCGVIAVLSAQAGATSRLIVLLVWIVLYVSLWVVVRIVEQGSAELRGDHRCKFS